MAVPPDDLFGAQIELELFNDLSFARDPACALALPTAENPCVRGSTTLSIQPTCTYDQNNHGYKYRNCSTSSLQHASIITISLDLTIIIVSRMDYMHHVARKETLQT